MSTISASTTSTTGFKVTSDTTGTLVFQTGASPTTAMSISSSQIISFTNPPTATGGGSVSTNTAFGTSALAANTTGDRNFAAGGSALAANTTGAQNAAAGYFALTTQTTGNYNAAFGAYALNSNTTASNNAAFGYTSLYSNTTGASNTGIGFGALFSNTTASNNTAIGKNAGYTNQTGANNVFVGGLAGYYSTGGLNTCVGEEAGYYTTGTNNTYLGYGAGPQNSGSTGSYNTFLGNLSGYLITTGSKNSILGCYNGNQGGLDIRTASNYIVLSDGDGNPRASINQYGTLVMQVGTSTVPSVNANIANSIHVGNGSLGSVSVNPNVFFGNAYGTGGGVPVYCGNWPASNNWGIGLHDGGSSRNVRIGGASVGTGGMSWDGTYANIYAGSYTNASDYRIKENVVALEVGVLASVMALRPVKYRIKKIEGDEQDNRTEIGFIAHELQAQFPELVMGEKDAVDAGGNEQHQGVDYAKMTAVLVKAIQELKAEFDAYKEAHP